MKKLKLIWAVLRGEKLYKESDKLERYLKFAHDHNIYTKDDLVSFGNYMLSDERNSKLVTEVAKKYVGDWDLENWKDYGKVSD